jgi:hypothetical protein
MTNTFVICYLSYRKEYSSFIKMFKPMKISFLPSFPNCTIKSFISRKVNTLNPSPRFSLMKCISTWKAKSKREVRILKLTWKNFKGPWRWINRIKNNSKGMRLKLIILSEGRRFPLAKLKSSYRQGNVWKLTRKALIKRMSGQIQVFKQKIKIQKI